MGKQLFYCNHKHYDCFACICGQCTLLESKIEDHDCPFYKSVAKYQADRHPGIDERIKDQIHGWERKMSC